MSRIRVHALVAGLTVIGASLLAPFANAAEWPQKEITLINNFPPGSATELTARAFARSISKTLGKTVVIKAVPGGAGQLGPADGRG